MGNYFYKYQETEEMLSQRVVDKKKEYNVYVVAYANKSDQSVGSNVVDKSSGNYYVNAGHYGIIIDLAGESEEGGHPKGFFVHLVLLDPLNSKKTALHFEDKVLKSPKIVKCVKVGNASSKLVSICSSEETTVKHCELGLYYYRLFGKYIKEQCNGDVNWSKYNNCHKFAKFCIHDLSLSWPETIISPIDEYPFLADLWSLSQDSSILTHKTS
ncbi:hypothetical protein ACTFIW_002386 [Dictyostelium discoideum]